MPRGCCSLLFFCLILNRIDAAETAASCRFSLKEEIPKNINFTVQAGRVAFLCKADAYFLRGTVTRTLPWQLTDKIFETLARETKAEMVETSDAGKLYRITAGRPGTAAAATGQKTLFCGYYTRENYVMDICGPETGGGDNTVKALLSDFRTVKIDKSPLLRSAPLFTEKRVFGEENETKEPALLALTMPPGYVEVTRRENRALFTDAAGLAEIEIFYELSELQLDSELAHKVYRKSITKFLTEQGSWRPEKEGAILQKDEIHCMVFTDNGKKLSHYCYFVVPTTVAGKKRFYRMAYVVAYVAEAVDRAKLLEEQQNLMKNWAAILRRHSN